ncbi:MAG: hypothetical protein LBU77_07310 [Clostridiales bacterium]|jgi:tRNA nucleotidyltransferase/poly(A) polymerase|nr:hypothetical protein [Clostridiales bacterium]
MGFVEIAMLVIIILGVAFGGFYLFNRWAAKRMGDQQGLIEKNKQTMTIYVIDKKRDYAKNIKLPKVVTENLPKIYRFMKMNFVQAKIGPQIMTFLCDKKAYAAIQTKKNVKVELAGIYILSVKGMKTDAELKQLKQEKKEKEKAEKAKAKQEKKNKAKAGK